MKYLIKALLFISLSCVLACGNDKGSDACHANYDQEELFTNLADNLIIPSFAATKSSVNQVKNDIDVFLADLNSDNLITAKNSFTDAYKKWQETEYYSFGPSENLGLNARMNNFPLNDALLEANINAGQYSLESPDNYYSGFPALDYLLFGLGDNSTTISVFENNGQYGVYLSAVINLMSITINEASDVWSDYRSEFINNTGTAAGTSISLVINSINENYENSRRDRLGLPAGFHDIAVPSFPDRVEGFYSGLSLELLKENMIAAKQYFTGANGEGLDDYLEFAGAVKESVPLEDAIIQQFNATLNSLDLIPETLTTSISNHTDLLRDAYLPMANQIVYLKTDMPSSLCVSITYIDNPSDSD